jgi:hypothetical protein
MRRNRRNEYKETTTTRVTDEQLESMGGKAKTYRVPEEAMAEAAEGLAVEDQAA